MTSIPTETITAMSSVFTPAAGCSNSWTFEGSYYNSISSGLLIQNLYLGEFNTACFPTEFAMYGRAPSSIQVYSPGACPSGYQTPGVFNNDGTTTAICCESGYSYATSFSTINFFTSSSVLFVGCLSTFEGTTSVIARANDTDLSSTVVSGPLTMWGQPVTVEYQQKDLSLFGTTSTSSSLSIPTSTTTSSTATATFSVSSGNSTSLLNKDSSDLSTGDKAGIAIAGILAVLIAVAIGVFLVRKRRDRRKRRLTNQDHESPNSMPKWARQELEGDDLLDHSRQPKTKPLQFPYHQSPVELSAQERSDRVNELE
ncbi:uncharacterized protein Z519_07009 [Cladophialophora bantiana CBS 173.52]|uniref:Uncharacterized protein n=1 Tax=Cladophialophora bantiana (strain ATCC 10958 / CBS 173.52 / CDC B-1940 / NIH 8579) TaxID=1442370 RepID=A0A0D2G001_CLAB1|nr:uncharacterized protein Z519_07009 [Cladophialophora bantiana CBS 173.52]KIW92027.1 hypothetical protein Z519_07009 [Cladophialophora bantiana CBS 173.52]